MLWRLLSPRHLVELWRRVRGPRAAAGEQGFGRIHEQVRGRELAVWRNPQLELYGKVLPGGFLHYGYFDDPVLPPDEISLAGLVRAQRRYAELVLEHVVDDGAPVLDIGAGMGGMARMLLRRGFTPVALTPDRHQVEHIQETLPGVEVVEGRFGDVGWSGRWRSFGTVLTCESLQYLFLDTAVNTIARLVRPGGRWVACDYFRTSEEVRGSGHVWDTFRRAATEAGWRLAMERDLTPHVLPGVAFVRMLGERVGVPLVEYAAASLRRKRPGLHYLLEEVLAEARDAARRGVERQDPAAFARDKRYMLVVLERDDG